MNTPTTGVGVFALQANDFIGPNKNADKTPTRVVGVFGRDKHLIEKRKCAPK